MRNYSRVSPQFWMGKTGKALRKHGVEAQMVALYLMTGPHANMLGFYYVPKTYIAYETGLGVEGALKGLAGCIEAEFCHYDQDSEVVWVIEMARFQVSDQLNGKDPRIKGVQNAYDSLPDNPYLASFFDMYAKPFCMASRRGAEAPLTSPSKPLASQEQEQEQKQEQEQEQEHEQAQAQEQTLVGHSDVSPEAGAVKTVFEYWQKTMATPNAQLDESRWKIIKAALKLYEPRQLCDAILGCSKSDFHMARGEFLGRQKYNGVGLIFRDADHIDKFVELASKQATGPETIEQRNNRILAELMGGDARTDANVIDIDMEEVNDAG